MENSMGSNITNYNRTKLWRIALFAFNNSATNIYAFALSFVTYYVTGIVGLAVFLVSTILASMRFFDAFTDPIIGFIIDKLETRFGKFRPVMIIGNFILLTSFVLLYTVTHHLPEGLRLPFFIIIHAVYIIGYTLQTTITRAGQTVLTNDPKQRPMFTIFDSVYNIIIFTGGQVFASSYLVAKHGDFTLSFFTEFNSYVAIISTACTILAVIAIAPKDRKENFGLSNLNVNIKIKDYWPVIKKNRPLQMLVIAASTDKLATGVMNQQIALVMFFGIILGDFALSGTISLITIVPSLLITYFGVMFARKRGMKKSLVYGSWVGFISFSLLILLLIFIDPQTINLGNIGIFTVIFLLLYSLGRGITTFTPSIVVPMIADVVDYETYKSGRYVPGMISTLFSFIDKSISSLAPAIIGGLVVLIGFNDELPSVNDTLTPGLFTVGIFALLGIPMLCWLISIIAMKFYHLNREKMSEIQSVLNENRKKEDNVQEHIN